MKTIISEALGTKVDGTASVEGMKSIVMMVVTRSPTLIAATVVEEGVKVLPLIGSLIAPPLSFAGTKSALNLILEKFQETALHVLKFVADSADRNNNVQNTSGEATGCENVLTAGEVQESCS